MQYNVSVISETLMILLDSVLMPASRVAEVGLVMAVSFISYHWPVSCDQTPKFLISF